MPSPAPTRRSSITPMMMPGTTDAAQPVGSTCSHPSR
jgi:hypothetical protein